MNPKLYYLSTCSSCKRIISDLGLTPDNFTMLDIKTNKITAEQLDEMKTLAGSYEALFSRRSLQYAARGLKDKSLTEQDYRDLILDEYTFLKRPVVILNGEIFIGNSKEVVEAMKQKFKD